MTNLDYEDLDETESPLSQIEALSTIQRGILPLRGRSLNDQESYRICRENITQVANLLNLQVPEYSQIGEETTFETYDQVNRFLLSKPEVSERIQFLGKALLRAYARYGIVTLNIKDDEFDLGEWNRERSQKTLTAILAESDII